MSTKSAIVLIYWIMMILVLSIRKKDNFYNVVVYYNGEFVEVNVKRITLEVAAKELYPEGYDLNTLFVDYKERKNATRY